MTEFIKACVHGFWLACVQDPPLYFDFAEHKGEKIEFKTHRCYTIKGEIVDFLVWPTVYIEEGGNILSRGVAQCRKDQKSEPGGAEKSDSGSNTAFFSRVEVSNQPPETEDTGKSVSESTKSKKVAKNTENTPV